MHAGEDVHSFHETCCILPSQEQEEEEEEPEEERDATVSYDGCKLPPTDVGAWECEGPPHGVSREDLVKVNEYLDTYWGEA